MNYRLTSSRLLPRQHRLFLHLTTEGKNDEPHRPRTKSNLLYIVASTDPRFGSARRSASHSSDQPIMTEGVVPVDDIAHDDRKLESKALELVRNFYPQENPYSTETV